MDLRLKLHSEKIFFSDSVNHKKGKAGKTLFYCRKQKKVKSNVSLTLNSCKVGKTKNCEILFYTHNSNELFLYIVLCTTI